MKMLNTLRRQPFFEMLLLFLSPFAAMSTINLKFGVVGETIVFCIILYALYSCSVKWSNLERWIDKAVTAVNMAIGLLVCICFILRFISKVVG